MIYRPGGTSGMIFDVFFSFSAARRSLSEAEVLCVLGALRAEKYRCQIFTFCERSVYS